MPAWLFIGNLLVSACQNVHPPQNNTNEANSFEIVGEYDIDPAKKITSDHLPTKTIQTPWGAREIPDQSRNQDLIDSFKRMKAGNNSTEDAYYRWRITNIQINDVLRTGCVEVRDSTCQFNKHYYVEDCGDKHAFGSNILSECEQTHVRSLAQHAIGYLSCEMNGETIRPMETNTDISVDQQIDDMLNYECIRWRGEPKKTYPSMDEVSTTP